MPHVSGREIKVLSIPGRRSTTQYVSLFCRALEDVGVKVCDLVSLTVLRLGVDVVHLHFPVHYIAERSMLYSLVRSAFLIIFLSLAKFVGRCVIIYTVHDPIPFRPRAGWLMWPMLNFVHRLVDGYIFLSDGSQRDFLLRYPSEGCKPFIRIDHSSFPVAVDSAARLKAHNKRVEDTRSEIIIGFLGMIKDYKGLEFLRSLPHELSDGTRVRSIIAGKIDPAFRNIADDLLKELGDHFERIDKRLSDEYLVELIQSVDVVFLPYTRGWNSGMAMLVLSCYTPILSTRQLPFVELEQCLGVPWVHTFDGSPETCGEAIKKALACIRRRDINSSSVERLETFLADRSFGTAALAVKSFYCQLIGPVRKFVISR